MMGVCTHCPVALVKLGICQIWVVHVDRLGQG